MADEVRFMWEAFISSPENADLLKRYAKSAKEPAPLFENIGEDLGSSKEEVRERAWRALIVAMPVLPSILYEREIWRPGWRDIEAKDQQMVNRGENILIYLHRKFVMESYFKIGGRYGKDPRSLVNRIARNWQKDAQRKHRREVPLDYERALKIPDPSGSLEDAFLENENRVFEEWKRELLAMGIVRSKEALDLYWTIYIDKTPLAEVVKSHGISSEATLRQRLSRVRKHALYQRDALLTFLLFQSSDFSHSGTIYRVPKWARRYWGYQPYEEWIPRAKLFVQPGDWLNGVAAEDKNPIAVRPLTRSLAYAPGHIYLAAIHKDYLCKLYLEEGPRDYERVLYFNRSWPLLDMDEQRCLKYIIGLVNPRIRNLQKSRYTYSILTAYPTELPKLNDALSEIRDDYSTWLLSNSLPDAYSLLQWKNAEVCKEANCSTCEKNIKGALSHLSILFGSRTNDTYMGYDLHNRISRAVYQHNRSGAKS